MKRSIYATLYIYIALLYVALIGTANSAVGQALPPEEAAQVTKPEKAVRAAVDQPTITAVTVRGNGRVETDAVLTMLKSRVGDPLSADNCKADIRTLYELGYFSDIRIYRKPSAGGIDLIFDVTEKPAIISIAYEGNKEVTEDNIKDKLETKLYTIENENTITTDVRMIEKQYAEKGYYLARVTYTLEKRSPTEVALIFHIDEGGKVQVGDVHILGTQYFTPTQIIDNPPGLASRPYTRTSAFGSSSLYQDDFVKRDLEYISYIYRDQGFAEVKVAKPLQFLDSDRDFVRLTFQVEEGLQYNVGSLDVSGDLLFPKEDLIKEMQLKPGDLFRYSRFSKDIEMLVDKYGDLGYAYVDVNPKTTFDRDKRLVHIVYDITKGEKVYFGKMTVVGNTKTRDNVIRREFEVADSELYSGTGLTNSKNNVNRLGFFEEVQVIKERDEQQQNLLNLKIKIKEKPTGQLQAAIGFSPNSSGSQGSQWFGQGRYDEKNQSGRGWNTNLSGKWNGEENYSIEAGFTNPRVNDSQWLAGTSVLYSEAKTKQVDDVIVKETRESASVFIGRKIIELIRGRITYRIQRTRLNSDAYLLQRFATQGIASSAIFSLSRTQVDNYIDPTEGSDISISQNFTGGKLLRGNQQFMESSLDAVGYIPIDFSDSYRTYFKLHGLLSYIYPFGDEDVPFYERYRLGGYNDMRGYEYLDIGPRFSLLRSPGGRRTTINKGGDKKLLMQAEYFMPLIPEANIKALLFGDMGRVYDDSEPVTWSGFSQDVGFGFRWITPIAPFRFEWAYPVHDGKLGNMRIIFYIGY